jgi:hypothetical protein
LGLDLVGLGFYVGFDFAGSTPTFGFGHAQNLSGQGRKKAIRHELLSVRFGPEANGISMECFKKSHTRGYRMVEMNK